jgi:hypothetical protein
MNNPMFALIIKVNHSDILDLCKKYGKLNPHITVAVGDYDAMLNRYNVLSKMLPNLHSNTENIEIWNDKLLVLKVNIISTNPNESLMQVWHKPDYPIHIYGLNPHITLSSNFKNIPNTILPRLDGITLHFNQEDLDIVKINNH